MQISKVVSLQDLGFEHSCARPFQIKCFPMRKALENTPGWGLIELQFYSRLASPHSHFLYDTRTLHWRCADWAAPVAANRVFQTFFVAGCPSLQSVIGCGLSCRSRLRVFARGVDIATGSRPRHPFPARPRTQPRPKPHVISVGQKVVKRVGINNTHIGIIFRYWSDIKVAIITNQLFLLFD